ncbi:MAG: DUF502 domain-containing protein [Chromatiales bacterium]|jgi:uncharacterized membrane protein
MYTRRYLVSGILTAVPLWVTWVLFDFVLRQLSRLGRPWVAGISRNLQDRHPFVADLLIHPWFHNALAVLITLAALYLLGWAVSRVVGRRILDGFESLLARVPVITTVYGGVKKLVTALQQQPKGVQRVVLIDFPHRDMKAVGLVTRTFSDDRTGEALAAVYVPTTPNPTNGYVEIVPVESLTSTNWSIDEAMNFVISGGAVAPERIQYHSEAPTDLPPEGGGPGPSRDR